ncbi:16S rRNA (guanine(966)-N(2))-methyltransferase RsmD [Fodinicola feengrottensis]|uniref:16S rRNA (Guanine(966)-N(2))-methyltransferase RsmD n=1 Tax=Fodinicola feengrottensis TaxID=435914 RepID=A0ABP4T5B6_9ACTN|nr:16S rRNA (guanine(966)-N(2))-methyltransferase RsmD [Fodinicola feengrottensis]
MTRIVAGKAGGRRLRVPPGRHTRPTADRTREALFSSLDSLVDLESARVLDLYAGSGAIGLEAASRGAPEVTLVESARPALAILRANISELGLTGIAVEALAVERLAATPAPHAYDCVFADPPYALPADDLGKVITDLHDNGWLAPAAVVVVERSSRDPEWVWPEPLGAIRRRTYGECALWYGQAVPA